MNIGLLQCDHVDESFQYIISDYPEAFQARFERYAPKVRLRVYDVCHGELPQRVDECDGYITTGSRYSVYDDVPWIHNLVDFVRRVDLEQHKLVGICFGHQMIAHALGGSVTKAPNGWGVGVKEVHLNQAYPWMQPETDSYRLLFMHQDQVRKLPPGAELIGSSDHCPVAMFTVGSHLLGVQAHPEFSKSYVEALMDSRIVRIGAEPIAAARQTMPSPTDEEVMTQWIAGFFESA
ncbi:MAG: type 1 glutamine amidotransferase [Anaerolineaceae bacterium]|nr:type 1 glutamine amidotransferase [Anaerolineaceae bacterium]